MPVHLPSRRAVVTAAPGTGSSSLIAALGSVPGAAIWPSTAGKHDTVGISFGRPDVAPLADGTRIVTTTRNPFDFWLAEYERSRRRWAAELDDPGSWVHADDAVADQIRRSTWQPFGEWLEVALGPDHARARTRHLNDGHVSEAHVVVRMEAMRDDLRQAIGLDLDIPHRNRTERDRRDGGAFTDRARSLVAEVHAPDLDRFGYRWPFD